MIVFFRRAGGVALATMIGVTLAVAASGQAADPSPTTQPVTGDVALERARAFVEQSDRYLHHSRLQRGMKGYGKTVMAGVTIERFEVEIVSVMTQWGPHQDVILAKLSGLGLEKTNVIAGMSGSPVYVVDPRDGKEKMIGAVAYGWSAQKEPLCGLQPITQMLAMNGVLVAGKVSPTSGPAQGESSGPAVAAKDAGEARGAAASKAFLDMVLTARNAELVKMFRNPADDASAAMTAKPQAGEPVALQPLRTPLMVSGLGQDALLNAAAGLRAFGMMPLQAGTALGMGDEADNAKLEPGSGIAVPLVRGDAAVSAVGTVTDVIDGKVLAFGHSFFSDGDVRFPMGPAYIHSVVSGVLTSFKLGALTRASGALTRDETVGIVGVLGETVDMIPVTVDIHWKDWGEKQQYSYELVRHRMFTPRLAGMVAEASILGWKNLPEQHALRYTAAIDFGQWGVYKVDNVSSGMDTMDVYGEIIRPLLAVYHNPWQAPPTLKSVTVSVTVEETMLTADVLEFKPDGKIFRPGDTLTGSLTIEPYRQQRTTLPVSFELPSDLSDGTYTLEVCDAFGAAQALRRESPQRFDPRNIGELLDAVGTMAANRRDSLYLRLPLPEGGLAIRRNELPNLPASKATVLSQTDRNDIKPFRTTLVRPMEGAYVFRGSTSATFEVSRTGGGTAKQPAPAAASGQ